MTNVRAANCPKCRNPTNHREALQFLSVDQIQRTGTVAQPKENAVTDLDFYMNLNTLVEEAHKAGLDWTTIVEDLRLLASAMDSLHVKS